MAVFTFSFFAACLGTSCLYHFGPVAHFMADGSDILFLFFMAKGTFPDLFRSDKAENSSDKPATGSAR